MTFFGRGFGSAGILLQRAGRAGARAGAGLSEPADPHDRRASGRRRHRRPGAAGGAEDGGEHEDDRGRREQARRQLHHRGPRTGRLAGRRSHALFHLVELADHAGDSSGLSGRSSEVHAGHRSLHRPDDPGRAKRSRRQNRGRTDCARQKQTRHDQVRHGRRHRQLDWGSPPRCFRPAPAPASTWCRIAARRPRSTICSAATST